MRGGFARAIALLKVLVVGAILLAVLLPCRGSSSAEASTSFVIQYCTFDNYTTPGEPPFSLVNHLCVFSNSTATDLYVRVSDNATLVEEGIVVSLSAGLASKLYQTIINDGFMTFRNEYNDTGASSSHSEKACVQSSGVSKIVLFHGNSLMGLAPASYAMLNNIERIVTQRHSSLPDATLGISVEDTSAGSEFARVSAVFTNRGDENLTDAGLCNRSWPTFIVSTDGNTVADLQKIRGIPECLMIFNPGSSTSFGPWLWNHTGLKTGHYVVMSRVVIWNFISGSIAIDMRWVPGMGQSLSGNVGTIVVTVLVTVVLGTVACAVAVAALRSRRERSH